jgi:hypothetical protein
MLSEKLQKLRRDLSTDGVGAMITSVRVATTIPRPPCQRIVRTAGQNAAEDVARCFHLLLSRVIG